MNPVVESIKGRRSVRSYKHKEVPKEIIEAVIDAGNWAPTGNNVQRWRFVVVQDKKFRRQLLEEARPTWVKVFDAWKDSTDEHLRSYFGDFFPKCLGWPRMPYEEMMTQARDMDDGVYWGAPVIIFVFGTTPNAGQECAMVCQNMMLAAHSLGLGTCIVGFGSKVTGDPEIVESLGLEENERIFGPVVLGYPRIQPEPPPKRDPAVKWV